MSGLAFLDGALADLEREDLLRTTRTREALPPGAVLLCSNDYLGLAAGTPVVATALGAGSSALVWGYRDVHAEAERSLAAFTGAQASLLFTSGYAANVGTVAALAGKGDLIVSDTLNHASLIDGCRLSGARVVVVPHLDLAAMAVGLRGPARRRFVVTESVFSMDGDGPDLAAVRALCDAQGAALILDEAHALGVLGPGGRGRAAEAGVIPDVLIGTLGKAFGLAGAFVSGSPALRSWLWNRARSYVFSTAIAPAIAAAVPGRVAEVAGAEGQRRHLVVLAGALRAAVASTLDARLHLPDPLLGHGPILPIRIGSAAAALQASRELLEEGWVVQAIRPPTVAPGTSRLRVTLRADLDVETVARAGSAIGRAVARACR